MGWIFCGILNVSVKGAQTIDFLIINGTSNPARRAGLNRDVVCSGQGLTVAPVFP